MSGDALIGRAAELARVDSLIAEAAEGHGGALVVCGDPGIGKTSLLAETRRAHQHLRVLSLTGVEVEQVLAYAALASLLRLVPDDVAALPEGPAEQLRGAVGLSEARPVGLEAHLALLELLGALGADTPAVVIVDDAQWIDPATLGLLGFVARRLEHDRVALIVGTRPSEQVTTALGDLETLTLGPLSREESREVLAGQQVRADVADACWASSQGSPLALTELAGALTPAQRAGRAPLPHPLPAAESVRRDVAAQLVAVTGPSRTALAVVAAEGAGDSGVIARALSRLGVAPDALDPALDAGMLRRRDGTLAWRHPLARSAVLAELPEAETRAAHRAVAEAVDPADVGRVAYHLAAAAPGCDDELAERLEAVALDATHRGASAAAAQAWEAAALLSSDDAQRFERRLEAIAAHWRLGDSDTTVRAAGALLAEAHDPVRRARTALLAGQAGTWWEGPMAGARLLREEAALVAETAPALAATLAAYASNAAMMGLQPDAVIADALRTRAYAERAEDPGLALMADAMEGLGRLLVGEAERALALLSPLPEVARVGIELRIPGSDVMVVVLAQSLTVLERWDEAAALLEELTTWCRQTGHNGMEAYASDQLADLEWRRGRWESIPGRVARVEALSEGVEQPVSHQFRLRQARLDAARGRHEAAERVAETALTVGLHHGFSSLALWAREVLALSAQGRGDDAAALRQLDAVEVLYDDRGVHAPSLVWWQATHVELLAAADRRADAERALSRLTADAECMPGHWARAAVAIAESALTPDAERAVELLASACAELTELGAPFELAQARLLRGRRLLESGQVAEGRGDLAAALSRFDQLDARPWAERAVALLGLREVERRSSVASRLSDAELRVASAIASGLTNRQAAAELFLSAHTVNSHLRAIYQRLGIHSRSQLATLLARESP